MFDPISIIESTIESIPFSGMIQTEAQFEIECECGGAVGGHAVIEGSVESHVFEAVKCEGCERTYTVEVGRG